MFSRRTNFAGCEVPDNDTCHVTACKVSSSLYTARVLATIWYYTLYIMTWDESFKMFT